MAAPFLDIGDNDTSVKHLRNRVHALQMAHLKAMQELERCEKMLHAQTNINRELALEIEDLTSRKVSASSVLQSRIKELEMLAEERQQRLHQLEAQIRQLKYARAKLLQKSRLSDNEPDLSSSSDEESSDVESISESLVMAARDLAPGEQLLELLIASGNFDRNVVSGNSSTFILCDFYDFESQTTPLLMGSQPEYSFSSTFKVTVDGFFLRYLASETLAIEVHQAVRGDFKLIGRAFVRLSSLLQSKGVLKEHTLPVKSIQGHADDKVMGTLSVLLRLSCPISEIWRLHLRSYPQDVQLLARENKLRSQLSEVDFLADEEDEDNQKHQVNELQVTVFGCKNLRSYGKKKGNTLSRIPSSYVHYQLLGFPDAFTNIVPGAIAPEYDLECSRQSFVMEIDACLLRFFAKFRLWLTVFDDQIELDSDDQDDGMIGRCGVLLSELTNGETIRGWFPLLDRGDRPAGEISVLIQWKDPFQVLQFISSRRARGGLDRPMDLHVLDFDQQHAVMKRFSPEMDGRLNYRQFLTLCLPSESLELITSKIKERFEYAVDTQQINSVEDAFKTKRDSSQTKTRIAISDLVIVMEKYGVFLSDAELDTVKTAFAPLRSNQLGSSDASNKERFVVLHYLYQHINPRVSCSARLLTHKLRHTVRGFLQQQKQKKTSEFLSPIQVFEKYDFEQSGQVSRAIFKRCLLVFGFKLLDIEKEYKDLVKASSVGDTEATSHKVPEPSIRGDDIEEIDVDAEVLTDSKSVSQYKVPPQVAKATSISSGRTRSAVEIARPATVSAAGEFQQRKQAFMDRMKAIASASSKSLVYEQLEKKHEQHRIDSAATQSANLPRPDFLNQQISRLNVPRAIHHDAAKTVQNQFRLYRAAKSENERALRCSILDADFQLQQMFTNWTSRELESLEADIVRKIEVEIPEAAKARAISRKQLGFVLSQVPRVAIDPALLNQLMEYFSISSTSPKSLVAYRPMIHFVCSVATAERVNKHEAQHPVLRVLKEVCLDIPHALATFESIGDTKSTGTVPIGIFCDALQSLGVRLSARDQRAVAILFVYNGAEFLYHAFLHMVERSNASLRLAQVLKRCQALGLSKLREKLLMHVNSEDGTLTKQDLHAVLTRETSEFAQFEARDAHVLFQMMNAEPNSDATIAMNDLVVCLEAAVKRESEPIRLDEMSRYNMKQLRKLAWNCRKLTCGSYGDLVSEFERFDWEGQGVVSLEEFVAVAEQHGLQALTQLQLKQIGKCFGSKKNGRFLINYRQVLDWTTPSPASHDDEIRAIFDALGEKLNKYKLDNELVVRKVLNLPVETRRDRKEHHLKKEDKARLTSALSTAFTHSRDKFQNAFQKFQEICVVHHFSEIAPSVFWKHMESSGFDDILSRKGVGLLTQRFLITYQHTSKSTSERDGGNEEMISLKAVHSFLREFERKATESAAQRASKPENEDRGEISVSTAATALRKLLLYCSDSGIDFRGEFEKFDTKYSGRVTAMEFKQVILDLGISRVTEELAPEAAIGQLVWQFRVSDIQDGVSYTSMLHQAILSSSIPLELQWYPGVSETLRARIRLKAGLSGKLDSGNPNLYNKLDPCFAHFDRSHKGFLTTEVLQQGLAALRYELTTKQVEQLITYMGMFRTGVTCISRMEFDSFVLDPYAVSVLEKLALDLFVVDSGRHGENIPRIAQLSCALLSRDTGNRGVVSNEVFWSCLEEILDTALPQTTKFSIQHLFDVNRDATIAYRLFMKVISQWQTDKPGCPPGAQLSEKKPEKPAASHAPAKLSHCSYQDLLRSLYNQISSLDFDSQVEIVEEHLQRKTRGAGTITLHQLMRIFDQIGIALSKSAEESLPHFFSDGSTADSELGEAEIQYDKIISALKKLHRQKDEEHKADTKE